MIIISPFLYYIYGKQLFYNNFVGEHKTTLFAALCAVTYVTCTALSLPTVVFEAQCVVSHHVVCNVCEGGEINTVG